MSIKKLTRAAQAAGYAMAQSDDLLTPTHAARSSPEDNPHTSRRVQDARNHKASAAARTSSYTEAAQQWFGAFVSRAAT